MKITVVALAETNFLVLIHSFSHIQSRSINSFFLPTCSVSPPEQTVFVCCLPGPNEMIPLHGHNIKSDWCPFYAALISVSLKGVCGLMLWKKYYLNLSTT